MYVRYKSYVYAKETVKVNVHKISTPMKHVLLRNIILGLKMYFQSLNYSQAIYDKETLFMTSEMATKIKVRMLTVQRCPVGLFPFKILFLQDHIL